MSHHKANFLVSMPNKYANEIGSRAGTLLSVPMKDTISWGFSVLTSACRCWVPFSDQRHPFAYRLAPPANEIDLINIVIIIPACLPLGCLSLRVAPPIKIQPISSFFCRFFFFGLLSAVSSSWPVQMAAHREPFLLLPS